MYLPYKQIGIDLSSSVDLNKNGFTAPYEISKKLEHQHAGQMQNLEPSSNTSPDHTTTLFIDRVRRDVESVKPIFPHRLKTELNLFSKKQKDQLILADQYLKLNGNSQNTILEAVKLAPLSYRWRYCCLGAYESLWEQDGRSALFFLRRIRKQDQTKPKVLFLKSLAYRLNGNLRPSCQIYMKLIKSLPMKHRFSIYSFKELHEVRLDLINRKLTRNELQILMKAGRAELIFQPGVQIGSNIAIYNIAKCYLFGIGCKRNYEKTEKYINLLNQTDSLSAEKLQIRLQLEKFKCPKDDVESEEETSVEDENTIGEEVINYDSSSDDSLEHGLGSNLENLKRRLEIEKMIHLNRQPDSSDEHETAREYETETEYEYETEYEDTESDS